jgi:Protein of unknown function (DUF992)
MLRHVIGAAVLAMAVVSAVEPTTAQRVRAGLLTCDVSGGLGFLVGSVKQVNCAFAPDLPGPQEAYMGTFSRFGLDIGITGGGVMVWAVFTDTIGRGPGFLAGSYVGASGEVTVAAGLGANVLVGGSNRTIALQPLSVSGQVGINLAVGVGDLTLQALR